MENRIETSFLMDYYSSLLTEKQVNVMQMYFDEDLSLGEIADINGISRQAIHDLIKRTSKQLHSYEDKLHLKEESVKRKEIKANLIETLNNSDIKEKVNLIDLVSKI